MSRIGKLVRLLASDKPFEVVAAARALQRVLESKGLDFHDLAKAIEPAAYHRAFPDDDEMLAILRCCHKHTDHLSQPELEVVRAISKWRFEPSPHSAQMKKLREIYEQCLKREQQRERARRKWERARGSGEERAS
jgi:hypothetical protein